MGSLSRLADALDFPGESAADRLAAMDFDGTDSPSVDQAFEPGTYRLPEPGECCLDVLTTVQLYWPALSPDDPRFSLNGE